MHCEKENTDKVKPNEKVQVEFILDCLRKGEQRKFILGKFGKKWGSASKNTFDRRLSIAKKQLAIEQERINDKTEQNIQTAISERTVKILTSIERQEILSQIAKGEIPLSKPVGTGKDLQMIEFVPDWMDRRNAIAELNKMDGDYAPAKTEVLLTDNTLTITRKIIQKK